LISIAEAPGKIILTGEHFVVHGAQALAAAINKRIRISSSFSPNNNITYKNQRIHSTNYNIMTLSILFVIKLLNI
jgi:mevalonate kinase